MVKTLTIWWSTCSFPYHLKVHRGSHCIVDLKEFYRYEYQLSPFLSSMKAVLILPFFHMATQLKFHQDFVWESPFYQICFKWQKSIFSCYINLMEFTQLAFPLRCVQRHNKKLLRDKTERLSPQVCRCLPHRENHLDRHQVHHDAAEASASGPFTHTGPF